MKSIKETLILMHDLGFLNERGITKLLNIIRFGEPEDLQQIRDKALKEDAVPKLPEHKEKYSFGKAKEIRLAVQKDLPKDRIFEEKPSEKEKKEKEAE